MPLLAALAGAALIFFVLLDAFEAIVLPRRATRRYRISRFYYISSWKAWSLASRAFRKPKSRDAFLSVFGPFSLLLLLGLWAAALIAGFALLQSALESPLSARPENFFTDLYFSGTTFFTLGFGDVVPLSPPSRFLAVAEAGMGFGFLAVVIGYLPVIYSAFSRRELAITLLDSRAGSPPSAAELLRRFAQRSQLAQLDSFFLQWELWAAELLESHLSYPVLAYYRSQHDNQSWLASVTAVLDACSLVLSGIADVPSWQASLTFAIARHAVVDLAQIFFARPLARCPDRLPASDLALLRDLIQSAGAPVRWCDDSASRLRELRDLYEPYVAALAARFHLTLPAWLPNPKQISNWQTSAWGRASQHASQTALGLAALPPRDDVH